MDQPVTTIRKMNESGPLHDRVMVIELSIAIENGMNAFRGKLSSKLCSVYLIPIQGDSIFILKFRRPICLGDHQKWNKKHQKTR